MLFLNVFQEHFVKTLFCISACGSGKERLLLWYWWYSSCCSWGWIPYVCLLEFVPIVSGGNHMRAVQRSFLLILCKCQVRHASGAKAVWGFLVLGYIRYRAWNAKLVIPCIVEKSIDKAWGYIDVAHGNVLSSRIKDCVSSYTWGSQVWGFIALYYLLCRFSLYL